LRDITIETLYFGVAAARGRVLDDDTASQRRRTLHPALGDCHGLLPVGLVERGNIVFEAQRQVKAVELESGGPVASGDFFQRTGLLTGKQ